MSGHQSLQATAPPAQQAKRRAHRCYTVTQLCEALEIPRASFFRLRASGELPFLEELKPRIGRVVRYRADLIDLYLDNKWNRKRA